MCGYFTDDKTWWAFPGASLVLDYPRLRLQMFWSQVAIVALLQWINSDDIKNKLLGSKQAHRVTPIPKEFYRHD